MSLNEAESASHVSFDCEAFTNLTFRHLGSYFLEPDCWLYAPLRKVPGFIRSVGLLGV
jgi:hypothetical protein